MVTSRGSGLPRYAGCGPCESTTPAEDPRLLTAQEPREGLGREVSWLSRAEREAQGDNLGARCLVGPEITSSEGFGCDLGCGGQGGGEGILQGSGKTWTKAAG